MPPITRSMAKAQRELEELQRRYDRLFEGLPPVGRRSPRLNYESVGVVIQFDEDGFPIPPI